MLAILPGKERVRDLCMVYNAKPCTHDYQQSRQTIRRYSKGYEKFYFNTIEKINKRTSTGKQAGMDGMDDGKSRQKEWQ